MSRRSERHRTSAKERFTIGCDQLRAKCGVVWYGYACLVCHVCQCTVFPSTSLMHLCILIPVPNRGRGSLIKPSLTTNKKGYHHLRDEIKKKQLNHVRHFRAGKLFALRSCSVPPRAVRHLGRVRFHFNARANECVNQLHQ